MIAKFAERFFFAPLDKRGKSDYNRNTLSSYGGVKVSTGSLRYDKRGGPGNPVKMPNLNNKRQQNCCSGCLIAVPRS